jgi:hypothetical protein
MMVTSQRQNDRYWREAVVCMSDVPKQVNARILQVRSPRSGRDFRNADIFLPNAARLARR